ncbi:MAG: hypothetical protein EOO58_02195 [Hymenobacter sp.]|nr:MAG: hypothetical protein EOO58_02195 [Hymenobacter sp.]
MPNLLLVPECHADTALARALVQDRVDLVYHQHGISKVGLALQDLWQLHGPTYRVLALVDADKKFQDVTLLAGFQIEVERCSQPGCEFRILTHPDRPGHYLVVLEPACDAWLFGVAGAGSLDLVALGLPAEQRAFRQQTKQKGAEDTSAMQRLLRAVQRSRPAAYQQLAAFVARIIA